MRLDVCITLVLCLVTLHKAAPVSNAISTHFNLTTLNNSSFIPSIASRGVINSAWKSVKHAATSCCTSGNAGMTHPGADARFSSSSSSSSSWHPIPSPVRPQPTSPLSSSEGSRCSSARFSSNSFDTTSCERTPPRPVQKRPVRTSGVPFPSKELSHWAQGGDVPIRPPRIQSPSRPTDAVHSHSAESSSVRAKGKGKGKAIATSTSSSSSGNQSPTAITGPSGTKGGSPSSKQ
ncbi:unnamed protein product [Sympodiomycopsis kandeliae]